MSFKKQQWLDELDEITGRFRETFGGVSDSLINQKPDAGTWSIAENFLHLIRVNESYFPVIDAVKEGRFKHPFIGRFDVVTTLLGNMIYKSVLPDRKRKVKTFAIWEPFQDTGEESIKNRFPEHQEELKGRIAGLRDEDMEVPIPSPASKFIVYKLHRALDIIVQHEQRHFVQAKEVMERLEIKKKKPAV